jgi:hypothetical protein
VRRISRTIRLWLMTLLGSAVTLSALGAVASASGASGRPDPPFLTTLGKPRQVSSTVPPNGDVNPYGVALVPDTIGTLVKGETLVSNFNDKANVQGTGTTIVEVSPDGAAQTFATVGAPSGSATCPGGIGLTTALSILPGGWVVVGSLPAGAGGNLPSANPAGCLIVLNDTGGIAETWSTTDINGPWDMTALVTRSGVDLFVANALSRAAGAQMTPPVGLCAVVRIDVSLVAGQLPRMLSSTVIGSHFVWRANKAALVQSPTGVALASNGTLYVAETVNNRITKIPDAATRSTAIAAGSNTLSSGGALNGPLGLIMAPDGDIVALNGNDGNAVEVTPEGRQVAKVTLVAHGAGDLFGATVAPAGQGLLFVNDGSNALDLASVR